MVRRTALVALLLLALTPVAAAGPRPQVQRPFVVVLDAGHGGENHGCSSADGTLDEKALTLLLATELADELAHRLPHAQVVLTRADDREVPLADRVAIANEAKADLFLSLHANASPARDQTGYETYVLDARASGLDAARTAQRENASSPIKTAAGDGDAATMLDELAATTHRQRAARFALAIQRAQAARFPERLDRGVRQAPFDVLLGARMPAVLFEAGFLDHATEGPALADGGIRRRIVDGLVEAIIAAYRETGQI